MRLTKREGLILYWCEGDKTTKGTYKVALTSTNVIILRLFVDWLTEYYYVNRESIKLRLHLWESLDENVAKKVWAKNLNIPIENFTKTYIKPKGGRKKIHIHGVCRASIQLKIIQLKILGAIKDNFFIS
jgi:hypothetical protein